MINGGIHFHPAGRFCRELVINDYSDWRLPSRDELEICYRFLKPTADDNYTETWGERPNGSGENTASIPVGGSYSRRYPTITVNPNFRITGTEAFRTDSNAIYVSSTQTETGKVWVQDFRTGAQYHLEITDPNRKFWVRAVRWVEI